MTLGVIQDLRYALRTLRKTPGFTAAVVATLALGIGVDTAIFGFVDRLLLRPLPFPESERLASLYFREGSSIFSSLSYPDYVYYRDHNDVFSGLAAYDGVDANLRFGDDMEAVSGEIVSANYFSVLGVSPILGRAFLAEEDVIPGRDPVLMLGYGLWQRRFGGDSAMIGRQVSLNGVSFTVIGIAPPGFGGLQLDRKERPEFWVPTMMYPAAIPMGDEWDLERLGVGDDCEVVGVAAEVQYESQRQQLAIVGDAFRPPRFGGGYVALRVAGNPNGLIPAVRRVVAEIEPEAPVYDARAMEEHVFAANSSARFSRVLLEMFAGLALGLAVVGIYGVFSYVVAARTKEFGIRIASGARAGDILKLVVGDGAVLCAAGLAACLLPALRATKVDPMVALRCE